MPGSSFEFSGVAKVSSSGVVPFEFSAGWREGFHETASINVCLPSGTAWTTITSSRSLSPLRAIMIKSDRPVYMATNVSRNASVLCRGSLLVQSKQPVVMLRNADTHTASNSVHLVLCGGQGDYQGYEEYFEV